MGEKQILKQVLEKLIEFYKRHVAAEKAMFDQAPGPSNRVKDNVRAIGAEFLNVDQMTLMEIILAADSMEITDWLGLACQKIAHLIEGKSPEEIQELIDMTCFYDAEENQLIKLENVCFPDMESILKRIEQHLSFSEDVVTASFKEKIGGTDQKAESMGDNWMWDRFLVCRILCGCSVKSLQELRQIYPSVQAFFLKIISIRHPLEEQRRAAEWIMGYMMGEDDSLLDVHHRLTWNYQDDVLLRQFMKKVDILEGQQLKPGPISVLLKWKQRHLQEYIHGIERELTSGRMFDLFVSLVRGCTGRKAEIDEDSVQVANLPSSMVNLCSSDGKKIEVEGTVAFKSPLIKRILGDIGCCSIIPLPNVHSTILGKVIGFCKRHVAAEKAMSDQAPGPSSRVKDKLSAIGAEFLNVDQVTLIEIILAADYMEITNLLDLACQKFVHLIEEKGIGEIQELIHMTSFCDAVVKQPVKLENVGHSYIDSILKRIKQDISDSEDAHSVFTPSSMEKTGVSEQKAESMGDNRMWDRFLVCRILCGCSVKSLQELRQIYPSVQAFFLKIISIRHPLEEQRRAAEWIMGYMMGEDDSLLDVHHRLTWNYQDDVLLRQFMKKVDILEGQQLKPGPISVLLKWKQRHLQEYIHGIERELTSGRMFDLFLSLVRGCTGRKAEIDEDSVQVASLPSSMVNLCSSDGIEFKVEGTVAFKSPLVRQFIGDIGSCSSIPLRNVHSTILGKVIEFCKRHVAAEKAMSDTPGPSSRVKDKLSAIGAEFLNVDQTTLMEIILAADYMEITNLLDLACQKFAHLIEEKGIGEIQELLDMTCFCDAEVEEPIKLENVGHPAMDSILKRIKQDISDSEDAHSVFTPSSKEKTGGTEQ